MVHSIAPVVEVLQVRNLTAFWDEVVEGEGLDQTLSLWFGWSYTLNIQIINEIHI